MAFPNGGVGIFGFLFVPVRRWIVFICVFLDGGVGVSGCLLDPLSWWLVFAFNHEGG